MEVKSTEKENKPISIRDSIRADQFFQTTYEKVLSLSNILDMVIYAMNEENQLFDPSQYCFKDKNNHA